MAFDYFHKSQFLFSQVAVLKDRLNKFTKEAAEVEIKLNKTKETISAADSLVEGLEGEFERWNGEVKAMEGDLKRIPQSALLGAAFLVRRRNLNLFFSINVFENTGNARLWLFYWKI